MSAFAISVLVSSTLSVLLGVAVGLAIFYGRRYVYERDRDRCTHFWVTKGAEYTPPQNRPFSTGYFTPPGLIDDLLYGFTEITHECSKCHKTRFSHRNGRVAVPGFKWSDYTVVQ